MNPFGDETRRDPFPLYEALRQGGPVVHFAPADSWFVLDYDGVKRALTDHAAFSSEVTPPTGRAPDWLIFTDPPRHEKRRAIILRAFTPRSIAALEPLVERISERLLADKRPGDVFDLVAGYAWPLPTMVIAELLGLPLDDAPLLMRWGEAIMNLSYSLLGGQAAAQRIAEHAVAMREMKAYLEGVFEARRRAPADDLITRLLTAEVDGERLDDAHVIGFFELLLAAGTETTTNLVANAVLCFAAWPDELARLRQSPSLLPSAIEEVLRFRSPAQMMFRMTRGEIELGGKTIPAGKMVLPIIGAANRDPRVFAEPQRFDIGRAPNPHIAFGHGVHFCIGAALARLEARVALAALLTGTLRLEVVDGERWTPRPALNVLGPAKLLTRICNQ
jgi:cytochrome P450